MILFNTLSAYFSADSPHKRTESLIELIAAYEAEKIKNNQDTVPITIEISVMEKLKSLAKLTHNTSVEELLSEIAFSKTFQHAITGYHPTFRGLPEAVIRPIKPITETISRIGVNGKNNTIWLDFPEKNDNFRDIVKSFEYQWDNDKSVWSRTIGRLDGLLLDRAAEIGASLLNVGFIITADEAIRERIITGQYKPEVTRWILRSDSKAYPSWFKIWWRRSEDCYDEAKRITAARYDRPNIVVPPEHFDEIIDFAEMNGFCISDEAQTIIESARKLRANAYISDSIIKPGDDKKIITDSWDIDDDLADND